LLDKDEEPKIVRLLPPASCPGHFDLSPRLLTTMRSASVVVRHKYQGVLEKKVLNLGASDISIIAVNDSSSLLIPDNYISLVTDIGSILGNKFPQTEEKISKRIVEMERRVKELEREIRKRSQKYSGIRVISAYYQKDFCKWLGMEVTGIFRRPEEVTLHEIEELMKLKAELVVGNLQEGSQAAYAIGERMGLPIAIFSNFPDVTGYGRTYDDLLRFNMLKLEEACRKE
jgi:zinc transport system substrate-binding protein